MVKDNYDSDTDENTGLEGLATICALSLNPNSKNHRLSHIMSAVAKLFGRFNLKDLVSVRQIIRDICLPNCNLRTSAKPDEVCGREKVFEFFQTYAQGCPDIFMIPSPAQFNVRVISFVSFERGTRSNFQFSDRLYDYFYHDKKTRDPRYCLERNKYDILRRSGLPIPFVGSSFVNFILNEEMTHVEKYIHTRKDVQVFAPPFTHVIV